MEKEECSAARSKCAVSSGSLSSLAARSRKSGENPAENALEASRKLLNRFSAPFRDNRDNYSKSADTADFRYGMDLLRKLVTIVALLLVSCAKSGENFSCAIPPRTVFQLSILYFTRFAYPGTRRFSRLDSMHLSQTGFFYCNIEEVDKFVTVLCDGFARIVRPLYLDA